MLPLSSLTLTLQVFASKQPLSPHFQNNHSPRTSGFCDLNCWLLEPFMGGGAKTLKTNILSFTMFFTCCHVSPFQLSASNNQLVRMFQVAKLHHLKVRFSLLFPSFPITITLIIPSSLPWSYHHLPHHDHHDCYHNHHLKLERSFFCSFKIVAFYCVSPPSADIFSFVSFCTSFVIPPVNFNLSEYNNPPISNWSFAQWLCPILVVFCPFQRWFKAA